MPLLLLFIWAIVLLDNKFMQVDELELDVTFTLYLQRYMNVKWKVS